MQIKELEAEGLSKTFSITVPKEDLATKLDAKIKEMQPQVTLKGFISYKRSSMRALSKRSMIIKSAQPVIRKLICAPMVRKSPKAKLIWNIQ